MALTNVDQLLVDLEIRNANDSQVRNRYDLLRRQVEAGIKAYCKWEIEQATVTDYYDGVNYKDIVLRRPYVASVASVWLDPQGYYGQASGAFPSTTLLIQGSDWALVYDGNQGAGQVGKSGLLRRLANFLWYFPSDFLYMGRAGGLSYWPPPRWPYGYGNVKVTYTYGFTAAALPEDLKLAVYTGVGVVRNTVKYGWPTQSENLADYSYSLAISRDVEFGTVRQLLAAYRDVPIGVGL